MTGNDSANGLLTDIEYEILRLAAVGMDQYHIAEHTGYSVQTIKQYRARMVNKLGASNLAAAISIAYARGILTAQQAA